jgi:hypothetical protein
MYEYTCSIQYIGVIICALRILSAEASERPIYFALPSFTISDMAATLYNMYIYITYVYIYLYIYIYMHVYINIWGGF